MTTRRDDVVQHRGRDIDVTDLGPLDGDAIVLHHGLLQPSISWQQSGFVEALAARRRVILFDSFGHGDSQDDGGDAQLRTREARADLVVAVMDALGVDRFDFVGYSMGGWIGGALLRRHGDRVRSVSIGGWDVEAGIATAQQWTEATFGVPLDFDLLYELAKPVMPGVADAPSGRIDGWRGTFETMQSDPPHDLAVLSEFDGPIHLWCGSGDAYHGSMEAAARTLGARFDSLEGDHLSAFQQPEAVAALATFLTG